MGLLFTGCKECFLLTQVDEHQSIAKKLGDNILDKMLKVKG